VRQLSVILLAASLGPALAEEAESVLLAVRRAGTVEVIDPDTLHSIGHIFVGKLAEFILGSPDGRKLIIAQGMGADSNGCCGLYALDLETRKMKHFSLGQRAVFSNDGSRVYADWGGLQIFDTATFERKQRIGTLAGDRLFPSPDGRWIAGLIRERYFAFDLIDAAAYKLVRRLRVPDTQAWPSGAWIGNRFYLFIQTGSTGKLWTITPDTTELGPGVPIGISASGMTNELLAAGSRLLLHEHFGYISDRRRWDGEVTGGVYEIDPESGAVIRHIEPLFHFSQVVSTRGGRVLYGMDGGTLDWNGPVRLVKMDAGTGDILAERALETDHWYFTVASIPKSLVPRGEMRPEQSRN